MRVTAEPSPELLHAHHDNARKTIKDQGKRYPLHYAHVVMAMATGQVPWCFIVAKIIPALIPVHVVKRSRNKPEYKAEQSIQATNRNHRQEVPQHKTKQEDILYLLKTALPVIL